MDILTDWHRTENIKEDETALGIVSALQVAVWKSLKKWDRGEWKASDNFAIEDWVEHWKEGGKCKSSGEPKRKGILMAAWNLSIFLLHKNIWSIYIKYDTIHKYILNIRLYVIKYVII